MTYIRLFIEFFQTGLFAIGGGMATIPFLYDMADKTGWFTPNDVANMVAISESTPGPIGVNMSTYIGYLTGMSEGGVPGALLGAVIATLGLITPSIIVILIVAAILNSFRNNPYVDKAFYGLRPASAGLIAAAGLSILLSCLIDGNLSAETFSLTGNFDWKALILGVILWFFITKVKKTKGWHPVIFIGISAVVGIVFSMG